MAARDFQLLLLAALFGAALIAFALAAGGPKRRRVFALVFIGVIGAIALSDVADLLGLYGQRAGLDAVLIPLVRAAPFLLAPALFFFVATGLGHMPGRSAWLHLLPALIAWGAFLWAEYDRGGSGALVLAAMAAFALLIAGYLVVLMRMLVAHLKGLKGFLSTIPDAAVARLRRLWLLLVLPVLSILGEILVQRVVALPEGVLLASGAFRIALLMAVLVLVVRDLLAGEDGAAAVAPYARSPMDAAEAEDLRTRLEARMAERQLHRDPLLTLAALAREVRIPEHRLSQLLNAHLGTTFYDFVNARRVEDAKGLLRERGRTVLDVSLEVGFNARSTFYTAFRKHAGVTPTEYRKGL